MANFDGHFGKDIPPFAEAIAWFLNKGVIIKEEFLLLSAEARTKAFTAAYVHAADLLNEVFESTLKAIEYGTTRNDFKKEVDPILTRPWHRETVFRTNVQSAYGAGHWAQAQAAKDLRPYARYSAVMDGRTRPSHAALHGLVYPLDSEFWKTYWPPWDYNCRCQAITLSQYEVDQEGYEVSQGIGPNLPPANQGFQSPAAGGVWKPDMTKYPAWLAEQLHKSLSIGGG